ncbi:hypothetical protein BDZ97DRAFT_1757242 [Flammula alnicola]|nr:hypothetical protein BDZ97DRAFT_1757242 [Flammula alnicola]
MPCYANTWGGSTAKSGIAGVVGKLTTIERTQVQSRFATECKEQTLTVTVLRDSTGDNWMSGIGDEQDRTGRQPIELLFLILRFLPFFGSRPSRTKVFEDVQNGNFKFKDCSSSTATLATSLPVIEIANTKTLSAPIIIMPPEESAITIPDSLQSSSDIRRGSAESSSSSLAQMKPSFYRISPSGEDVPTSSKSAARSGVVPRENRSVFTVADDVHVAYETRRPSPPSQLPISELPVEIILHCFSLMPLKSLILSQTVCKSWRHLVPHANLLPNRRRLLELYDTIINSPHFLQSRPWTIDNLTPFDRQAYLDALLAQLLLWILEWPARAVIRCMWPGLPYVDCKTSNIEREQGVNFLARSSPEVSAVVYKKWTPDVEFIPAFLVWRTFAKSVWLVLHPEGRPNIFGRVFVLDTMFHPNEIPFIRPEDEDKVYWGGHFDDFGSFQTGSPISTSYGSVGEEAVAPYRREFILMPISLFSVPTTISLMGVTKIYLLLLE